MKRTSIICAIALASLLVTFGCATDHGQKPAETKKSGPIQDRLRVGMTKEEVRKAIGEPAGTSVSSNGQESWRFSDSGKVFIPFYSMSGGKIQNLNVNFDSEGKVKDWSSSKQGLY